MCVCVCPDKLWKGMDLSPLPSHKSFAYHLYNLQTNMKLTASFILFLSKSIIASGDQSVLADKVSVGDRPYFLLDLMKPSFLKDELGKTSRSISLYG